MCGRFWIEEEIAHAKGAKDGKWRLVARYDTCHGWPHLDVVNGKGELVLKRWMEGMDTGEAFRWAVLDLEENHEKYN